MAITLAAETQKQAIASIQRFFDEHMDEEVGELKGRLLLDFVLKEIGPTVYNQAIRDAQAYFQDRVTDLDGTCYEAEFDYWR